MNEISTSRPYEIISPSGYIISHLANDTLYDNRNNQISFEADTTNKRYNTIYLKSRNTITNNLINVKKVAIIYDSNGYISQTKTYRYNNGTYVLIQTNKYNFNYSGNYIEIIDYTNYAYDKFVLNFYKVNQIITGYNSSYTKAKKTIFNYQTNYTYIYDYMKRVSLIYYDNDQKILFERDSKYNAISYSFHNNKIKMKTNVLSSSLDMASNNNNLISNGYFINGITSWIKDNYCTIRSIQSTGTDYEYLGNKALEIKTVNTNTFYQSSVYTEINRSGKKGDKYTFLSWIKENEQYSLDTKICEVTLSLYNNNTLVNRQKVEVMNQTDSQDPDILCEILLISDGDYNRIKVEFCVLKKDLIVEVRAVQLYNHFYGTIYNRDEFNNVISTITENNNEYTYNQKNENGTNKIKSTNIEGNETKNYYYNNKELIEVIEKPWGIYERNTYDENNNCIKKEIYKLLNTVTNNAPTKETIMYSESTYISKKKIITSHTDYCANTNIIVTNEDNYLVTSTTDPRGSETTYTYNTKGQLQTQEFIDYESQNNSEKINITYNSRNNILRLEKYSGRAYVYSYNSFNQITNIELYESSKLLQSYTYKEVIVDQSNVYTGLIETKKYGSNGDTYKYLYDDFDRLSDVLLMKENTTTYTNIYHFDYDEYDRLVKITDKKVLDNSKYYECKYNELGSLKEEKDSGYNMCFYSYDNLQGLITKLYGFNENPILQVYENLYRSDEISPLKFYNTMKKIEGTYTCFFNQRNEFNSSIDNQKRKSLTYTKVVNNNQVRYEIQTNSTVEYHSENGIDYVSLNGNSLDYTLDISNDVGAGFEIGFWYKQTQSLNNKGIFKVEKNGHGIEVYVDGNNYVNIRQVSSSTINNTTSMKLKNNYWNYIAIAWEYSLVDNEYSSKIRVYVNYDKYNIDISNNNRIIMNGEVTLSIGSRLGNTGYSNPELNAIYLKKINAIDDIDSNTIKYYEESNEYIFKNNNKISGTNIYFDKNILDQYEVFPLNSSLNSEMYDYISASRNIHKPKEFIKKDDINPIFRFNSNINRSCYRAYGSYLEYELGINDHFTIMMNICIEESNNNYLFELKDTNNRKIGLYRASNNKLYLMINNTSYLTNISIENNLWYKVALSFRKSSSSTQTNIIYEYIVKINTSVYESTFNIDTLFTNFSLMLGRKYLSSINPLYGLIEMMIIFRTYQGVSALNNYFNNEKCISSVKKYNEFNLLTSVETGTDINKIIRKTITYNNIYSRVIPVINNEIIYLRNKTTPDYVINYFYESRENGYKGKLIQKDNIHYTYDYRGYLLTESGYTYNGMTNYNIEYEYNQYGNITKKTKKNGNSIEKEIVYTYNLSTWKDQLITYDNKSIVYNNDYIGNPVMYGTITNNVLIDGYSLTWEGRQLKSINNTNGTNVSFEYNENGLREKKIVTNGIEEITYTYRYTNGLLVYEHCTKGYEIRYLYDNDNMLIGFINESSYSSFPSNTYYYVRNSLLEIIGITDKYGYLKVSYEYDAYGNMLNISGESANTVGVNNQIRYKGYMYDVETGLFYCNSRYYNPEWGRWISPDSIDYLDHESINGLNLYAYCNNDPVKYYDPSGHFVITLTSILVAAGIGLAAGAIVGGVAGGIIAASNGDNVGFGILAGAIGGGIMGAGAGVAALFLAPVIVGEGIMFATATGTGFVMGTAVSTGAAIGIGLGVSAGTGMIGGGMTDLLNQIFNNQKITDPGSIFISAVEGGALNMLSGLLGSLGGTILSNAENLIFSLMLNTIPSGYGIIIDIIKNYYNNKRRLSYAS